MLLLESVRSHPAIVVSRAYDVLARNPAGSRLFVGIEDWPAEQRKLVRYSFLHPAARDLTDDWDNQIRDCVALVRTLAGTDPDAPDLARLEDELILRRPEFNHLWKRCDVKGALLRTQDLPAPAGRRPHRRASVDAQPAGPDGESVVA
ncbi:MmyB family transcriptional regulator [Streptomyces dysideae]|uniref:MmyB family transcriptional regulator n=1 Tax=Streptomyces dysideae TaxID=909626 RepID=UPI000A8972B4|nr:hypothetical protein [Streptomyces dysideae]